MMWHFILFICLLSFHVVNGSQQRGCKISGSTMDCQNLGLQNIPCVKIPNNTETLILSNNLFTEIPKDCFKHLNKLSRLYIQHCSLTKLNDLDFDGLTQLRNLYLDHCKVKSIASGSFQPLENLNLLDLGFNSLVSVPDVFMPPTLKHLGLACIGISSFNFSSNYSELSSLVIDLSQNKITTIDEKSLSNLKSVNTIKFKLNNLKNVSLKSFSSIKNSLVSLDVSENPELKYSGILSILMAISPATNLKNLNLAKTGLNIVNSTLFQNLKSSKLIDLNLRQNRIDALSADSFKPLGNLQILFLMDCSLVQLLPNQFEGLKNLQKLYLNKNEIQIIQQGALKGLNKLFYLDLSYNSLVSLNCSVLNLKSLTFLNFSHNSMISIKDCAFNNLISLLKLDLSFNSISNWQAASFQHLNSTLESLLLSHNNISAIFDAGLRSHNRLNNSLANLKALKFLDVSLNPFDCTCRNVGWFVDWMNDKTKVDFLHDKDYLCYSPKSLKNQPITKLNCSHLAPTTLSPSTPIKPNSGGTIAILIVVPIALACFILFFYWKCKRPNRQRSTENLLENEDFPEEYHHEPQENSLPDVSILGGAMPETVVHDSRERVPYDDVPENFLMNGNKAQEEAPSTSINYDLYLLCSPDATQWNLESIICELNNQEEYLRIHPHDEGSLPSLLHQLKECQSAKRVVILYSDDLAKFFSETSNVNDAIVLFKEARDTNFLSQFYGDLSPISMTKKSFIWTEIQKGGPDCKKFIIELLK